MSIGISDQLCGQVDGSRCLLGDESKGHILILFVDSDEKVESSSRSRCGFIGMKLEVLGECSTPHCLAYLNNGVMFVGSRLGDSQLIKVNNRMCLFSFVTAYCIARKFGGNTESYPYAPSCLYCTVIQPHGVHVHVYLCTLGSFP